MASSPLHEHGEQYDARNNFLFFALGLVSLSQGYLDRMREAWGPARPQESGAPEPGNSDIDLSSLLR